MPAQLSDPQALKLLGDFEGTTVKQLEAFILDIFPVKEVLKMESTRVLWNPIFNTALNSIHEPNQQGCSAGTSQQIDGCHGT